MKTRELSLATFVLAAFGASIAACGAHGTTAEPEQGGSGADTSRAGGAGAPVVTPGAGSGGALSSAAGAYTLHAGAPGSAGAGVSFGGAPAAAGASPGGAGAPASTGCVLATGAATDLSIDDFEDGDGTIQALGSRKGYWYTFNDMTSVQVPTSSATVPFAPVAGGYPTTSKFTAKTSGPAFTIWGAGIGFHFNEVASAPCAYNATAYSGIKFWAKSTAPFKAMVQIPATTAKTLATDDAACAAMCNDHFFLAVPITAAWTQYTIDFAAATFKQEGWGSPATFDKTKLLGVQFQVAKNVAFDFSIDEVAFY